MWCKWYVTIEHLSGAIFEKELTAFHVVHMFHLFNRYVFILLTKMRTETKTVLVRYIFNSRGCTHTDFRICASYCFWLTLETDEFLLGKAKRCFRDWPFVYFSGGFISYLFGDYANIKRGKSDHMKAWNSISVWDIISHVLPHSSLFNPAWNLLPTKKSVLMALSWIYELLVKLREIKVPLESVEYFFLRIIKRHLFPRSAQ